MRSSTGLSKLILTGLQVIILIMETNLLWNGVVMPLPIRMWGIMIWLI